MAKTKVKRSAKTKKIKSKEVGELIKELEEAINLSTSTEPSKNNKKPIVQDCRSFKGYPPDAIPYPKNMLKATLDMSEGSVNASLNKLKGHVFDLAKKHIGRTPDPTSDLLTFLAELKSFVKTDQVRTRRSVAWLETYEKAYNDLVKRFQSEEFKEKSDREIVNCIVQFVKSTQSL